MIGSCDERTNRASPRDGKYLRSRTRGFITAMGEKMRNHDASVGIEFALIAPILCILLLGASFFGIRISQRMNMEQIIRAGAEVAVTDPGSDVVFARMKQVALAKGYTNIVSDGAGYDELELVVARTCSCPFDTLTNFDCSTICSGGRPPVMRYRLVANLEQSRDLPLISALGSAFHVPIAAPEMRVIQWVIVR